uniref:Uncharacterized protein n=1 Tax=Oryza punctata TaxID=4537 RepID=A0A0E0L1I6_ORYPU
MESALVEDMEAMEADYERLLWQRNTIEVSELAEMAALEEIPEIPRATEEEDQLTTEDVGRFRGDTIVLVAVAIPNSPRAVFGLDADDDGQRRTNRTVTIGKIQIFK